MEETKLIKTSSSRQPSLTDPSPLYQQCQSQLLKLNQHLALFIASDRNTKLNTIVPSITQLDEQITRIQQNIQHDFTLEESSNQKQGLLEKKQKLLRNIQAHSKKIEKYKKQMVVLGIDHEELMREWEENKRILEERQSEPDKEENQRKVALLSIFSNKSPRNIRNENMEVHQNQPKWPKIDKLFNQLSNLQFNGLSRILVQSAKRENRGIKGVFRNYKTNQKIAQYVKSPDFRKELQYLLFKHKKQ